MMDAIEALDSFRKFLDIMVETSVNYDQRAAFNYAAGEAARRVKELRRTATESAPENAVGAPQSMILGGAG